MKLCGRCKIFKSTVYFSKSKMYKDGFCWECKQCKQIEDKKYRDEHKQEKRKRDKEYYEANKEKQQAYHKMRYVQKKEAILKYHKEYYQNNKDKVQNYAKTRYEQIKNTKEYKEKVKIQGHKWRKHNKDRVNATTAYRRAMKLKATPKWLTKEHKQQILNFYKLAEKITKETGIVHHVDHIMPLVNKVCCGLHVPWNLQVIPAIENLKKNNKIGGIKE